jgi:hypothetical protein
VVTWTSDDTFTIDGVEYVCRPVTGRFRSTSDQFCLLKARWQVEWYEQLLYELAPRRMIEVGMYDGASIALCAQLADPNVLIGIDNRDIPSAALDAFIADRQLHPTVRPHYGVDQSDTARLDAILDCDLDGPLDLVVDDASHLYETTRITFSRLYPRLRPGGTYVIEDWPMHRDPSIDTPLTLLVFELVLACAAAPRIIANVTINRNYAVITRGDAELDSKSFALSQCYGPRAAAIVDGARLNARG